MQIPQILVVDDEPDVREVLTTLFTRQGYQVTAVPDGEAALEAVQQQRFHVALLDLRLPRMDGITLLRQLRERDPQLIGIILTGYATVENAVEAMKAGAFDYLMKPFNSTEVRILVQRALEFQGLKEENARLRQSLEERYRFGNLVGTSKAMRQVFDLIQRVADSDSTILILGESGTGKELVARTIHYNSPRRNRPLIPINCAAIPEGLLESELFGHEKGAFTGATHLRVGRFEQADGGTLFLDEIGEMSPALQAKLLRVLQYKEFERVGGTRTIRVNVRIIAATHRNLEELVAQGRFREDLFYRINVIPIHIPPLRERKEDIPLLLEHFLAHFNRIKGKHLQGFSPEAMRYLLDYSWPGNIRELENLVERLVILKGEGIVEVEDLPEKIVGRVVDPRNLEVPTIPDSGIDLRALVEEFENRLILQALKKAGGVKNRAARLLSLNRTTLVEKLKKKKLPLPDWKES